MSLPRILMEHAEWRNPYRTLIMNRNIVSGGDPCVEDCEIGSSTRLSPQFSPGARTPLWTFLVQHCRQPQELGRNTLGDDVMLQMGGDFGFEDANAWFKNLDVLMEAVNSEGRINVS